MSDRATPPFRWSARLRSFAYAARGLRTLAATQHNARLHLAATLAVVVAGLVLRIDRVEWAIVALACGLVLAAEAANTAVERLSDAVTTEFHPLIRDAKDLAAGAVLASAVAAAVAGLCVFVPRVLTFCVRLGMTG